MCTNIALIAGGYSSESEVSMRSLMGLYDPLVEAGFTVYPVIISEEKWEAWSDKNKTEVAKVDLNNFSARWSNGSTVLFDFAYVTIHGTPGENGLLTGYLDMMGVPYSCCPTATGALTFNKFFCNHFLSSFGITISPSVRLTRQDHIRPIILAVEPGLPAFVKPNDGGSSVATTKVTEVNDLLPAIQAAFEEGDEVVIERLITGTEVTCGCYRDNEGIHPLPITEVVTKNSFFDYNAKYNGEVTEITPARISDNLTTEIQALTAQIYQHLDAAGIIRVDYIIENERPVLLEVNTTPGMTQTSFIPQQVRAAGLNLSEVLKNVVLYNISTFKRKKHTKRRVE